MAHVLTIDHDSMMTALEKNFLEANGHIVTVAATGKDGLRVFEGEEIDAVLLAINLPDTDGFVLCRKLRNMSSVPIIFVTAKERDEDVIQGMEMGADDYITKPFNPSIMMARLNAHLAIHERLLGKRKQEIDESKPDIQSGDLQIFVKRHQVFRGNTEVNLTVKEFNLLLFLARHPNQVFSKRYLFEMIWHLDAYGELATVTVHINRLRDKLNKVKPSFSAIETVWGNGYRFRAS